MKIRLLFLMCITSICIDVHLPFITYYFAIDVILKSSQLDVISLSSTELSTDLQGWALEQWMLDVIVRSQVALLWFLAVCVSKHCWPDGCKYAYCWRFTNVILKCEQMRTVHMQLHHSSWIKYWSGPECSWNDCVKEHAGTFVTALLLQKIWYS